jgi:putative Mg2+ transporter-C (MgtC) family protein
VTDLVGDIEWTVIARHLIHLGIAYILALPTALDRERAERSAGLRTFPLVSIGACAYMLTGISVFSSQEAHARVMYGIVAGIGFIGGGAILKRDATVTGTATAASLWNTGALGIAVAWQRYEIAITLAALNYLTLRLFTALKDERR